jgi:hypothetical protein
MKTDEPVQAFSYSTAGQEAFIVLESTQPAPGPLVRQLYHFFLDQSLSMDDPVAPGQSRLDSAVEAIVAISNSSIGAVHGNSWVTGWDDLSHELYPTVRVNHTLKKEHAVHDLRGQLTGRGFTDIGALVRAITEGGRSVLADLIPQVRESDTGACYNVVILTDAELSRYTGDAMHTVVERMLDGLPLDRISVRTFGVGIGLQGKYVEVFEKLFPSREERVVHADPKVALDQLFGCPYTRVALRSLGPLIRASGIDGDFSERASHQLPLEPGQPFQLRLNAEGLGAFDLELQVGTGGVTRVSVPAAGHRVDRRHLDTYLQREVDAYTKNRLPRLGMALAAHPTLAQPDFLVTTLEPALAEVHRALCCKLAGYGVTPGWATAMEPKLRDSIATVRTELQAAHQKARQTSTLEDPVQLAQQITKARSETEELRALVAAESLAAGRQPGEADPKCRRVTNQGYVQRRGLGRANRRLAYAEAQLRTLEERLAAVNAAADVAVLDPSTFLAAAFESLGLQSMDPPAPADYHYSPEPGECTICCVQQPLVTAVCCPQTLCMGCAARLSTCPFCRTDVVPGSCLARRTDGPSARVQPSARVH